MTKKVLLLPGDGIGPEVISQAEKVLNFLTEKHTMSVRKCKLLKCVSSSSANYVLTSNEIGPVFPKAKTAPFMKKCLPEGQNANWTLVPI